MIENIHSLVTPSTSLEHEPVSRIAPQLRITDNLTQLLSVVPADIRDVLDDKASREGLIEIVMDLGREAEARFADGRAMWLRQGKAVTADDIDFVVTRVGAFGKDNRAGIERTLHRISAIRNRQGKIVGLTCRVGRAVYGTIDIIRDVVESGKSILMLGRPGRGKTTKLREMARVLSEEFAKRVVIVDTSNEIAGDGDIPHPAIGRARRMQVADAGTTARRDDRGCGKPHAGSGGHRRDRRGSGGVCRTDHRRARRAVDRHRPWQLASKTCSMNPTLCDLVGGFRR